MARVNCLFSFSLNLIPFFFFFFVIESWLPLIAERVGCESKQSDAASRRR
jgi:hypothetical protein